MRRKDLKQYTNRYNGLTRHFVGRGKRRDFDANSYARRLWQCHVSDCYYYNQLKNFGVVFHPREYWSYDEHRQHCRRFFVWR